MTDSSSNYCKDIIKKHRPYVYYHSHRGMCGRYQLLGMSYDHIIGHTSVPGAEKLFNKWLIARQF